MDSEINKESFQAHNVELHFGSRPCDIFYNKDLKAVHTVWKGIYSSGAEFRKILDEIINLMSLKKTSAVIADARNMKVISGDDQQWIVNDWYPRAIAAGFKYEALVVTENTFNELTIKKIVDVYDEQKVKTEYFTSFDDAGEWVFNNCR